MEILPEVPETLAYLSERHHVILMTKGNPVEQAGKVERSGLKEYFAAVEIVPEKGRADLPLGDRQVRAAARSHLDGREQSEVRHQSCARGRACTPCSCRTATPGSWNTKIWRLLRRRRQLLVVERFADLRAHF